MMYREIIAVCSEIHTKHKNTQRRIFNVKPGDTQSNQHVFKGQVSSTWNVVTYNWRQAYSA
jgi:hypothetical protein